MILSCWRSQSQMAGGYYLSFQERGEEVGMLSLVYAWCSFLSQKLDDQDIHIPAPQRPTVSAPAPRHISGIVLLLVGKGVGVQRYLNICESNTTDTSEHLSKAEFILRLTTNNFLEYPGEK